jgi:hypothetical protein
MSRLEITYKALNDLGPSYTENCCSIRMLRSYDAKLLFVPRMSLKMVIPLLAYAITIYWITNDIAVHA